MRHQLEALARINGRCDIHALDRTDMVTISDNIARHTGIEHA